ncbi:MAG: hypothetical protein IPM84_03865 [Anaerolineae bacterium]|nr:hypothetical protein [Anaerolineae bacterium]
MNTRRLLALTLIFGLLASTAAAAPLAGPCVPGAAYNAACDANQDGQITVTDIQLTAGHWNQNGAFVSDSNHNHLGQTWTGSNNPLTIQGAFGAPSYAVMTLNNTVGHGLAINSVAIDGIYVGSAGYYGMVVNAAGQDGVYVGAAGSPSSAVASASSNGFEVAGAQGDGLYVGRTDRHGVNVTSAGEYGFYVGSAFLTGLYVNSAGSSGVVVHQANVGFVAATNVNTGAWLSTNNDAVYVAHAGNDGIDVYDAAYNGINAYGAQYAGYFSGNINVTGNCVGCLQANFAVNAGDRPLQPGDVVSIQAITPTDFDTAPALWQVVQAQSGQAVVGVVAGRAELVTDEDHRPSETGKRLVPREGAAEPGEYVTIVYSGPMQVRIAPGESAIAAGTRLTAAAGGRVRPLGTIKVQLAGDAGTADLPENAPFLGVALEAAKDGLVWVLVNPQ